MDDLYEMMMDRIWIEYGSWSSFSDSNFGQRKTPWEMGVFWKFGRLLQGDLTNKKMASVAMSCKW